MWLILEIVFSLPQSNPKFIYCGDQSSSQSSFLDVTKLGYPSPMLPVKHCVTYPKTDCKRRFFLNLQFHHRRKIECYDTKALCVRTIKQPSYTYSHLGIRAVQRAGQGPKRHLTGTFDGDDCIGPRNEAQQCQIELCIREYRLCNVRLYGKFPFIALFGWVFKNELSIVLDCLFRMSMRTIFHEQSLFLDGL